MTAALSRSLRSRVGTPLGVLELDLCGDVVVGAGFVLDAVPAAVALEALPRDAPAPLRWLQAYFFHPESAWRAVAVRVEPSDVPGTAFQRRVWRALQAIPPGHTRTYGALATELGTAARAIGGACRSNPCALFIPCHRVVAKGGAGGFMGARGGARIDLKAALLRHEAHASAA